MRPASERGNEAQDPHDESLGEDVQSFLSKIPQMAEQHREIGKRVFGIDLDYSAESIARLDQMISEGWPDGPPALLEQTVLGFGCYLAESIRHLHGGHWGSSPEHGLHFDVAGVGIKIFPFARVEKRFLNGEEDSLGYYYSVIRSKLDELQPSG